MKLKFKDGTIIEVSETENKTKEEIVSEAKQVYKDFKDSQKQEVKVKDSLSFGGSVEFNYEIVDDLGKDIDFTNELNDFDVVVNKEQVLKEINDIMNSNDIKIFDIFVDDVENKVMLLSYRADISKFDEENADEEIENFIYGKLNDYNKDITINYQGNEFKVKMFAPKNIQDTCANGECVEDAQIKDVDPETINKLIKEEEDAVKSYENAIQIAREAKDETAIARYQHIIEEEMEHIQELKDLLANDVHDSKTVKDEKHINEPQLLSEKEPHYTIMLEHCNLEYDSFDNRVHNYGGADEEDAKMNPYRDIVYDTLEEAIVDAKKLLDEVKPKTRITKISYSCYYIKIIEWSESGGNSVNENGEDIGSFSIFTTFDKNELPEILRKRLYKDSKQVQDEPAHITFGELDEIFKKHNRENGIKRQYEDPNPLYGVVVFSNENAKNGQWKKEYPLDSRSYKFSSANKYFISDMIGNSIFAESLDGSDSINLVDPIYYWDIEYCYIENM